MYKIDKGTYFSHSASTSGQGYLAGWEASSKEDSGEFLAPLKSYGFESGVPVDPVNNATGGSIYTARANATYTYLYARYSAGSGGCDSSKGNFYVLGIIYTATAKSATHPDSPGFSCSGRNWQSEFSWVTGGFEN